MGKSRRNRGAHRSDPINKPVKPPSDPELAAIREKSILPVVKDLQSPDPKSRTTAAGAVANIVQDEKCRKLLLREQIVNIVLTETLTDTSLESRAAGWEILRTLVAHEESDFCVHLYRRDVLTAIEHTCNKITQTLVASDPPFAKAQKAQQRFTWEVAASLTALISALAVARDEILESMVKKQEIFRFLFTLISYTSTPADLLEEVLSCLMALSEDNLQVSQSILADQSQSFGKLMKLKPADGPRAVLACGILHNVFSALQWNDNSPGQDGATDAILVTLLSRILEQTKVDKDVANGQGGMSSAETVQLAIEILATIATDLQAALENGNKSEKEWNGFDDEDTAMDGVEQEQADEDDEEIDGDEEDRDDDHEMDDDAIEADMDNVTGPDIEVDETSGIDDVPTLKELLQQAVPQLIRLSAISVASDDTLAIQSHALSALNNIAWTVSCIDFAAGENDGILRAWEPVGRRIWAKVIAQILSTDTADINLASTVTSLAWAVSRSLQGNMPLSGDEHRKFISLYQASKSLPATFSGPENAQAQEVEDPFQSLGVKCIGVLGQLAREPASLSLNREIGVFLVTVISSLPNIPAAEAVEALNQLFDIYGDENSEYDKEVFWKDGFLEHLEPALPKVKILAKQIDKRTHGELRTRIDEAILNVGRFIQYKKKHMP